MAIAIFFGSMEDLKKWLKTPTDFEQGRRLYDKYGANANLKRLFKRRTIYSVNQLKYELGKLYKPLPRATPPPPAVKAVVAKQPPKKPIKVAAKVPAAKAPSKKTPIVRSEGFEKLSVSKKPKYSTAGWPKELREIEVVKGGLLRERSYYQNRLDTYKRRADTFKACRIIVRNTNEINRIWHILDTYHTQKVNLLKKELPKPLPDDTASLKLELINRVRPNITKIKKKLAENPESPKAKVWKQQIEELNARQAEIESKINAGE